MEKDHGVITDIDSQFIDFKEEEEIKKKEEAKIEIANKEILRKQKNKYSMNYYDSNKANIVDRKYRKYHSDKAHSDRIRQKARDRARLLRVIENRSGDKDGIELVSEDILAVLLLDKFNVKLSDLIEYGVVPRGINNGDQVVYYQGMVDIVMNTVPVDFMENRGLTCAKIIHEWSKAGFDIYYKNSSTVMYKVDYTKKLKELGIKCELPDSPFKSGKRFMVSIEMIECLKGGETKACVKKFKAFVIRKWRKLGIM